MQVYNWYRRIGIVGLYCLSECGRKSIYLWESSEVNYVLLDDELDSNEKLYYEISDECNGNILNSGYFIKVLE